MVCWVLKVCSNTCSASAKAVSASPVPQVIVQRDFGVALAGEILQIGQGSCRLQFFVHDHV